MITRLASFSYRRFERLFSPDGLPLVAKQASGAPTTSVLVRGGAGTGKTTLALSLAHAIAVREEHPGIVLFMVTEAVLADVAHKAKLLALQTPLKKYSAEERFEPGTIAVCHLQLEVDEQDLTEKPSDVLAMETAFALLKDRAPDLTPIRAIVIDGLLLTEREDPQGFRTDFIGFLQSTEHHGACPIIVEEAADGSSELLTFTVDVVLELSSSLDPDTGRRERNLVVSKCRYADSVPGPHALALDEGRPTVWPESPVAASAANVAPCGFFYPLSAGNRQIAVIDRGGLVLSFSDKGSLDVVYAISKIPGAASVVVSCGPLTTIDNQLLVRQVPVHQGPAALRWSIHDALARAKATRVELTGLEYFLGLRRFAPHIPVILSELARCGYLVRVHGTSKLLEPFMPLADFAGPVSETWQIDNERLLQPRRYRSAPAWTSLLPDLVRPEVMSTGIPETRDALDKARAEIEKGDSQAAHNLLRSQLGQHGTALAAVMGVEAALLEHQLGQGRAALQHLRAEDENFEKGRFHPDARLVQLALAWAFAALGEDWQAGRRALAAMPEPQAVALWRGLWASHVKTRFAHEWLTSLSECSPLGTFLLARAAAKKGELAFADDLLAKNAERTGMATWQLQWQQADLRFEAPNGGALDDALRRYTALAEQDGLSPIARADALFNSGWIHELQGRPAEAEKHYRAAQPLNPLLDLVSISLERLTTNRRADSLEPDR